MTSPHVTGSVRLPRPLGLEELAAARTLLRREEIAAHVHGLQIGPDRLWFDNAAPLPPGMDGTRDAGSFASGLAALLERLPCHGASGQFVWTSPFDGLEHLETVDVVGGVVLHEAAEVEPAPFDEPDDIEGEPEPGPNLE
ncbi:hypothetical protein LAZ40_05410 [Cereibacter sphaeroides]|uniref:hypothetical protein n=1 Tax=Cereibacter sphaeroides TaxID=1063 RepID=UPI001F239207|nr:hypothetical protein [Cereibacter sphaeroides]MCE6958486.1 hypothetical protein [Cereibacter sphaeroides]MCE6972852.1 hypothetical protein [Cereibacter sphaeroides]